uniref:MULE transposase domain-containing protein n=1 Tax=Lactuca sativa TaxID=4236 RepID=A0A9R1WSW7_LACSA|nr:hypothetical protein LSAT_V11C100043560 [Lactuca sativa]
MIFVPFTGLLSSESIESYSWLLYAFKKAFSKEPNVIVTDQDVAILQAVAAIFKNARHRLCMWHISQKFTNKFGSYIAKTDVLKKLIDLVWNETILKEYFESTWKKLMDEFHLNENNLFNEMYKMRDLWIASYFKECTFSGLMRTTSRFEAENYFYGLLSNSDLHLIEFSTHFDTALEGQRCIQRKNEHDSRYTKPD